MNKDTFLNPSFSFRNRLLRVLWYICYILLFRYSFKTAHNWRSFLLRLFGAKIGKNVHIYPGVKIWAPWNLEIKDCVGIADGVDLYSQDKIYIGYRSVISQRSFICTGTHDFTEYGLPLYTKSIKINNYVWIAAEAFIGPGVTIGEGGVVGARSVVTKDIEPWIVVAGNPSKYIKKRKFKTIV